jgi:HD superfamily phosphohydrolase
MHILNREFDGKLELAIAIFSGQYEKAFLHQLVSSQLDMDRMDYLTRDSFFTGVAEGVIGYDRIIKMLTVIDGELVVEEKGILSIERFLLSRYFMYSQVYLHRTVIAAEQMLKKFLHLLSDFDDISENSAIFKIWRGKNLDDDELIQFFAQIDDFDIISLLKKAKKSEENILSFFADGLLNRRLFKTIYKKSPFSSDFVAELRQNVVRKFQTIRNAEQLVLEGTEQNTSYIKEKDEIKIFTKSNGVVRFSDLAKYVQLTDENTLFFICHPPFN